MNPDELILEVLPNGPVKRVAVLDSVDNVVNIILADDTFSAHLASQGVATKEIGTESVELGDRVELGVFVKVEKPPLPTFKWRGYDVLEWERPRLAALDSPTVITTLSGAVEIIEADLPDLIAAAKAG
jgi:hypothetical protein